MPARPLSTGMISFGLVSIPVKVYASTESSSAVSFNMLHATCRSRLKQQYICTRDGEVVGRDQTVKGYEFTKGQYVVFTEEELKGLAQESSRAIEIAEFIPAALVDPVYFDGAYYLGPDKGGDRPYRLLAEAMRRTGRAALARWAARGKQYLVMIRATPEGLVMQQLHYADEVRSFTEVPQGEGEVKEAELGLALQLIEQTSSDEFRPENYTDEVRKTIQDAIQQKIEGQEVVAAPEEPKGQIIDLMEALKASLKGPASKAETGAAGPRRAEGRKPARRAAGEAADGASEGRAADAGSKPR